MNLKLKTSKNRKNKRKNSAIPYGMPYRMALFQETFIRRVMFYYYIID